MTKKITLSIMLTGMLLMPSYWAHAESDINFSASTAINYLTGNYVPDADPDTGFEIKPTTLDVAFTTFGGNIFASINYNSTIRDDYTVSNKGTIENMASRLDYGITAGYRIIDGLNIFAGYKVGETELKTVRTTGTTSKDGVFRDKGPFLGLAYSYNFGRLFTIAASAAYADMDGEIRFKDNITGVTQATDGATSGLSYGLTLSKEVRDGTMLTLGYKQHEYKFDDKDLAFGSSSDLDQEFDTIFLEVRNYF